MPRVGVFLSSRETACVFLPFEHHIVHTRTFCWNVWRVVFIVEKFPLANRNWGVVMYWLHGGPDILASNHMSVSRQQHLDGGAFGVLMASHLAPCLFA